MRFISTAMHKRLVKAAQIVGVIGAVLLAGSVPVRAATFTVDTTTDDAAATACDDATPNDCSLRGAILAANMLTETSTINVPAGTYVLSQSSTCTYKHQGNPNFFTTSQVPLCVAKNNVTIQGAGAATTIIDGNRVDRVLFISADATVQISGVTITRGDLAVASFGNIGGGGGMNNQGLLTLTESAVTDSAAVSGGGGGIYNAGTLTVLRSTVSRNSQIENAAAGGGIYNEARATLTVADSTISDNIAGVNGGGINNFQGTVAITGSTISGNSGNGLGGGIVNVGSNFPGLVTITNSTISGNTSGSAGGGIYSSGNGSTVHLNNVTITNNTSGGPVGSPGGAGGVSNDRVLTLQNTIIAGNRNLGPFGTSPDCGGTLTSQGYNLIQNTAECFITGDTTGNITGQDPQLGLLADNGGLTKTHAPVESSPAVDAGNPAAPGSGGNACATTEQRGFLRPLGAACDIGTFERGGAFSLAKILPNIGGNIGSVSTVVSGNGFASGATVKLTRAGQPDIVGTPVQGDVGGSAIAATFDLVGRSIGPWDVVVRNPDGTSKTLAAGFAIEAGRAPELWVDIIAPRVLRPGRPSRLNILYGNRGNVDAVGVPLSFSFPIGYAPSRSFAITPPPPQPGQVRDDWSRVPVDVLTDAPSGFINIPLLLPVVPAGFTGILQMGLTSLPGAQDSQLLAAIGDPVFHPGLDPQFVSDAVAGAQAYLLNEGVTVPPALVPDLELYVTNQFQQVKESGRAAFVANLGTQSQVYSMSQLHFDLISFAAVRVLGNPQASATSQATSAWVSAMYRSLVSFLSQLGPAEAQAQQSCPVISCSSGQVLPGGCSCSTDPNAPFLPPDIPIPPKCNTLVKRLTLPECRPTEANCDSLGTHKVVQRDDGSSVCVPKNPPKSCPSDPIKIAPGAQCRTFPLRPRNSFDPNDKVGTLGATPAQFLLSATPLSYTVFFENLETATAAAQEVVITDQLDVNTMDLDTFSLGPLSFGGSITLVPAPGVQQYTGGVDLRPEQNLIVTITASLDKTTGLLTWRFTSIDPDTGQFTEDPEAGFLPPNVNPPEGEGSVAFTVEPKSGLASGTTICNQASIVFDTNPAIVTPEWCNTIDDTPPSSAVQSLSATQPAPDFTVQWAGSDSGSGIGDYTIFVSENGGPFTAFLTDTPDTSALFTGVAGNTYAFYSVARDLVGNVENTPAGPDTQTTVGGVAVHDLAVLKIIAPQIITLTGNVEERTKVVKVQIQNRSPHSETINAFTGLVSLELTSLGSCPAPTAVLISGPPQKKLPVTLKPKGKLEVLFRVTFDCANDLAKSTPKEPGHEDYSLTARVNHVVLDGNPDTHPADDVCPRSVTPPFEVDPNPDGTIKDKGCGEKKDDKTFGAPVLVDVVVKP